MNQQAQQQYNKTFHFDGLRGIGKTGGRWISREDALRGVGWEWWSADAGAVLPPPNGQVMELRQYDTYDKNNALVKDHDQKPIWEYGNGDMYLGTWKMDNKLEVPVEDGFGILFNWIPKRSNGKIYIGSWKGGHYHGRGKLYWLELAKPWVKNHLPCSEIFARRDPNIRGGRGRGLPYIYVGKFHHDKKSDRNAVVTLKDGTTRRGPWENDKPVGNWWSHEQVLVPPPADPRSQPNDDEEEEDVVAAVVSPDTAATARKRKAAADTATSPSTLSTVTTRRGSYQRHILQAKEVKQEADVCDNKNTSVDNNVNGSSDRHDNDDHDDDKGEVMVLESPLEVARRDAAALIQEDHVKRSLQDWLKAEGIGSRVLDRDLKLYAEKLIEEGLETKDAILELCTIEDIQGFAWMKPFHKKAFLANVADKLQTMSMAKAHDSSSADHVVAPTHPPAPRRLIL